MFKLQRFLIIAFLTLYYTFAFAGPEYQPVRTFDQGPGFNQYEISAATISALFGRSVNTMFVKSSDDNIYYVKYTRPDDGSIWTNKCKFDGTRIIWGSLEGRWRTHPLDSRISYEVKSGTLIITEHYDDGPIIKKYKKSDFK